MGAAELRPVSSSPSSLPTCKCPVTFPWAGWSGRQRASEPQVPGSGRLPTGPAGSGLAAALLPWARGGFGRAGGSQLRG